MKTLHYLYYIVNGKPNMNSKHSINSPLLELSDDDKEHIREIFFELIVSKLNKLNARLGNLNCDFAGQKYKNWNIRFETAGSGFDIVDFEYDEEGLGMDLDL